MVLSVIKTMAEIMELEKNGEGGRIIKDGEQTSPSSESIVDLGVMAELHEINQKITKKRRSKRAGKKHRADRGIRPDPTPLNFDEPSTVGNDDKEFRAELEALYAKKSSDSRKDNRESQQEKLKIKPGEMNFDPGMPPIRSTPKKKKKSRSPVGGPHWSYSREGRCECCHKMKNKPLPLVSDLHGLYYCAPKPGYNDIPLEPFDELNNECSNLCMKNLDQFFYRAKSQCHDFAFQKYGAPVEGQKTLQLLHNIDDALLKLKWHLSDAGREVRANLPGYDKKTDRPSPSFLSKLHNEDCHCYSE